MRLQQTAQYIPATLRNLISWQEHDAGIKQSHQLKSWVVLNPVKLSQVKARPAKLSSTWYINGKLSNFNIVSHQLLPLDMPHLLFWHIRGAKLKVQPYFSGGNINLMKPSSDARRWMLAGWFVRAFLASVALWLGFRTISLTGWIVGKCAASTELLSSVQC